MAFSELQVHGKNSRLSAADTLKASSDVDDNITSVFTQGYLNALQLCWMKIDQFLLVFIGRAWPTSPTRPSPRWQSAWRQGISESLLDVHSVKDVQQSLFFDFFTCQKYEQKNFKISLQLSLSATSLFTRAIWGGVGCFSAVVAPVGSCFALQSSWIIFGVPSHCQILFYITHNLATFITLYSIVATNLCTLTYHLGPRTIQGVLH